MTIQFITDYLYKKIEENENYIFCTFYDLRVRNGLTELEVNKFLELSKIRLENIGYQVYFTGAKYMYNDSKMTVQDNEYMVAIKT